MEPREAEVWGKCFVLVMVWACGAHMDARQRECFDARLRGLVRRVPSMAEFPLHSASTIWDGEAEIGDTTALPAWPVGVTMVRDVLRRRYCMPHTGRCMANAAAAAATKQDDCSAHSV